MAARITTWKAISLNFLTSNMNKDEVEDVISTDISIYIKYRVSS